MPEVPRQPSSFARKSSDEYQPMRITAVAFNKDEWENHNAVMLRQGGGAAMQSSRPRTYATTYRGKPFSPSGLEDLREQRRPTPATIVAADEAITTAELPPALRERLLVPAVVGAGDDLSYDIDD